jgi:mercuric ion transport protein
MSEAVSQRAAGELDNPAEGQSSLGESAALTVGGIAALLVGACCLGPLVLVSIGLGGAWLANLTALEPYRPIFAALALVCLAFAWRRIYRPVAECKPGEVCAVPAVRRSYKTAFWFVGLILVVMFAFPYVAPILL